MSASIQIPATHTIQSSISELRQHFNAGKTRSAAYRSEQLKGMKKFLKDCEQEIYTALKQDMGKPEAETMAMEITMLGTELNCALKNLKKWMRPKRVATALIAQPGKSMIYPEPLGLVLIFSAWNYPLMLALAPVIGALAAGNTIILKPSELAPATSLLLARKLPHYIDRQCLHVIQGGPEESTALLAEKFDYIFYTGNAHVGQIVMTAAAKHLTPVTLELGGKSPCIVDASANIKVAAQRIVWAKFSNAGQTCVAPDYVLVDKRVKETLLKHMKQTIQDFYGSNPQTSKDYGRIINDRHFQRIQKLLQQGGEVYCGGETDASTRYIAPTILLNAEQTGMMSEEIFGPLLPVIEIENLDEAISYINMRAKPLSLYIFTEDRSASDKIIQQTSSGSVSINYPMLQLTVPDLPFGGTGASGFGSYHGKYSFDTFTHYKSVLDKNTWLNPGILYPPYSAAFMKIMRWLGK